MKSISVSALFSLTLLLSVSSAMANSVLQEKKDSDTVPVVLLAPSESVNVLKVTAQKAALSGGVGLVEGALAQKFLGADQVLKRAGNGDPIAALEVLAAGLVLWRTGHVAREQLQDSEKNNDSLLQEIMCTLAGFGGFAAGMKLGK